MVTKRGIGILTLCIFCLSIYAVMAEPNFGYNINDLKRFLGLTDTPNAYTNTGGFCLVVDDDENEVVFRQCNISIGANIADTNASTECTGDQVLLGNSTCASSAAFYDDTDTNTGFNVFDQWLNISNSPIFNNLTLIGNISADNYFGDGSGLTGVDSAFDYNMTIDSLFDYNMTIDSLFDYNMTIDSAYDYNMTVLDTDTNATTECTGATVLLGNSSCMSISLFGSSADFTNVAYLNNTGQTFQNNQTFTNNITVNEKVCFNSDCDKFIWENGTAVIIQG